jgi:hypothetical protein
MLSQGLLHDSNEPRIASLRILRSSTGIRTSVGIWRASPLRLNGRLRRRTYRKNESEIFDVRVVLDRGKSTGAVPLKCDY